VVDVDSTWTTSPTGPAGHRPRSWTLEGSGRLLRPRHAQALLLLPPATLLPNETAFVKKHVFMIVVHRDAYTMDLKALMKLHRRVGPRRPIIPFCAYNTVGYREQVRETLMGSMKDDR
jgi:hypothetical protein